MKKKNISEKKYRNKATKQAAKNCDQKRLYK